MTIRLEPYDYIDFTDTGKAGCFEDGQSRQEGGKEDGSYTLVSRREKQPYGAWLGLDGL
jgi:hypothetical protein